MAKITITDKNTKPNKSDDKVSNKAPTTTSPKTAITNHTKINKSKLGTNKYAYPILIIAGTVVIAVVIVLALISFRKPTLNEEYFTSDDTKSVITMSSDDSTTTNHQTHFVYEYDGDKVVGLKTYFEYQDAETAKAAYESSKNLPEFKNSELNGNYIIVTADPSQFEGLTADDVRQQEEAIKQFQASKNPQPEKTDDDSSEESKDQLPEEDQ